jgi:hypothetical protein
MSAPIMQIVIEGARKEWLETDKAAISSEWWEALLGYVPDDVNAIDDKILLVLTVLWLQESMTKNKLELENIDDSDAVL